ncbi:hypothetical protein ACQEU3_37940 [Spirillospora sp. CA-253888]
MRTSKPKAVTGAAAGLALGVMVVWAGGGGTGAAGRAASSGDRPVAATGDELLHRASERLIARCMARAGFAYTEQPPPSPAEPVARQVLGDVEWARRHGYGLLPDGPGSGDQDSNSRHLAGLTPEGRNAWYGRLMGSGRRLVVELPGAGRLSASDNGCVAEARRALYGDLAGWYRARRIVDHLDGYAAREMTRTPRYRAGLAAWAGCVRERGYAVSSPRELRRLATPGTPAPVGGQAKAREIAAAVAEAECATSTGFSRAADALHRRYRTEIEGRFARELDALKSYERDAAPRARRILADSQRHGTVRPEQP